MTSPPAPPPPMPHVPLPRVPSPPLPRVPPPWSIRVCQDHGQDLDLVHRWMRAPHVAEFWQQNWPKSRWQQELRRQVRGDHSLPCLALLDGTPVGYLEVYRVCRDRLAHHYPCRPSDLGVHVAIGERGVTGKGLGRSLLRAVAQGLLAADPSDARVVAEPDVRNTASLRAFTAAGFRLWSEIRLPDKTAALFVCPGPAIPAEPEIDARHKEESPR